MTIRTHASIFSGIGGAEIASSQMGWRNVQKEVERLRQDNVRLLSLLRKHINNKLKKQEKNEREQ